MTQSNAVSNNRFKLILSFLIVSIVSLVQPGCNCSSSSGGTTQPSAITSVNPLSNSATALVGTNVMAVFRDDMDETSVISAFSLTINGGTSVLAIVSYDVTSKTAILNPSSDLLPNTQYVATMAATVTDINGVPLLSTDFVWSFSTSSSMQLVSKNISGVTSNDVSKATDIDATGHFIVFESEASNLTTVATTLNRSHIYRKDMITGEVLLVSSDVTGLVEANNQIGTGNPAISSNGRFVVFESNATNLDVIVPVNPNGPSQIYLKDMNDGSVSLVSRSVSLAPDDSLNGAINPSVSNDGRYIIFESADVNLSLINGFSFTQIYRKDMSDESVEMISRSAGDAAGNGASTNPAMSTDGTHIVFESVATNLNTSSGFKHIYYVDTNAAHAVETISITTAGLDANADSNKPSVADDGSIVVFDSDATNLDVPDSNGFSDVFFRNRVTSSTRLVSSNSSSASGNGDSGNAQISGNGTYVVFESLASDLIATDTFGIKDIFVRNLAAFPGIDIARVNNPDSGIEATATTDAPVISADGRYVGFHSIEQYSIDDTDTLVDVFRAYNSTHP